VSLQRRVSILAGAAVTAAVLAFAAGLGGAAWNGLSEQASSGPPVTVSAVEQLGDCQSSFVFPRAVSEISRYDGATGGPGEWKRWAAAQDGVVANRTYVSVNVAGRSGDQVTITGLRFDVRSRRPPIRGSFFKLECGGPVESPYIEVNLDRNPPRIQSSSREKVFVGDQQWKLTPVTFPWTVTRSDTATFLIYAGTRECYCEWTAQLSWQSGGTSGVAAIDDDGKPFRISSSINSQAYSPDGANSWAEVGGDARLMLYQPTP
jgi:hypothetical protein